jgi:putative ABC transport system permease protein
MDFSFLFSISIESLGAHKLRTFLTMLGVIIGVAAVIAMLSIGEGAKQEALEQIEILGINNVIITARVPDEDPASGVSLQRSPGLSLADGENISEFSELVANVVPQRFEPITAISYRGAEAPVRIVSTTPEFVFSSSIGVEYGRFITELDMTDFSQICVLGSKAKRALFVFDDPIGKYVRIGDLDFKVVGVMVDKYIGRGKVEGLELKNFNEDVYIPLTTAQKKLDRAEGASTITTWRFQITTSTEKAYNTPEIDQLTITVTDLKFVPTVTKLVERIIERRHAGVGDYEIVVPESLLRQSQKTQQIFNIVMGAKRNDIMRQFLIEAVTICLLGCTVGLVLGLVISRAIAFYAGWPTIVSIFSIVLSIGVSSTVGIVFGLFPAHKASTVNVIEALRYE